MKQLILVFFLISSMAAFAGKYSFMELEITDNKDELRGNINSVFSTEKLKMDFESNEGSFSMMYFKNGKKLYIIDHANKSYMLLDENTFKKLKDMMNMLNEQLKALPPEQQEMMKSQMLKVNPQMKQMLQPTERKYQKTNESGKKGKYQALKYNVYEDENLVSEVWTASIFGSYLDEEDFSIFQDYANSVSEMFSSFSNGNFDIMNLVDNVEGFPVEVTEFEGSNIISKTIMKAVGSKNFDENVFKVPSNYTKKDLPLD